MERDYGLMNTLFSTAEAQGRSVLFEYEVYELLKIAGMQVPEYRFCKTETGIHTTITGIALDKSYVIKVVSEHITHKTEAGGVKVGVPAADIPAVIETMQTTIPQRFAGWLIKHPAQTPTHYRELLNNKINLENQIAEDIHGFLLVEHIEYSRRFGEECIVGAKLDPAFGPVVMVGPGGTGSEFYASAFKPEVAVSLISADTDNEAIIGDILKPLAIVKAMTGAIRGENALIQIGELVKVIRAFQKLTHLYSFYNPDARWHILEVEANPCVCANGVIYPLDGFLRFAPAQPLPPKRPYYKIKQLLDPGTVGIIGISATRVSPAGTILKNFFEAGLTREQFYLVHPQEREISGCRCFQSLDELKEHLNGKKIDLFVVAVPVVGASGKTAEDVIRHIVQNDLSESLLIISAGFDETEQGKEAANRLRDDFFTSRSFPSKGPIACGPNTLGNIYGIIDTRFVPRHKSSADGTGKSNAVMICQSGAYLICRLSNLAGVVYPAIGISIGNQLDLTFSDYLNYVWEYEQSKSIDVYGVYIEGLKEGDGAAFLHTVRTITSAGKAVIVYKAGRTPEGQDAAKGHTASIAGDYIVSRLLLRQAGAYVAESFEEFQDIIKMFSLLADTTINPPGIHPFWKRPIPQVAALSNAGFEKCAVGDNLYYNGIQLLSLAEYSNETNEKIKAIFAEHGLLSIIDIGKILDLTPMANDIVYAQLAEAILSDEEVDCGLIAAVPETNMLNTLKNQNEDFSAENSFGGALARLRSRIKKPWIVSVESGYRYEPLVSFFEKHNIPTFRSVDIAALRLGLYINYRRRLEQK